MQEINRTQAIKIVRLASFVLAAPLLTVLFAACQERSAADRSGDVAGLTQLEKVWARIDMDEATLSDLLGDDFIGRWGDGTQNTKPEMLAILRSGTDHYTFITLGPLTIRFFGDLALVTGYEDEGYFNNGKDASGRYTFTDIWIKRGGKWRMVGCQTAKVPVPSAT